MNSRAAHALRRAACLCSLAILAAAAPALHAQSAAAPALPPAAPAYEDRLIGGGTLTPDISLGDYQSTQDTSGLARSVRIDLAKFTLIGATTRTGLLTTPLRDRFGIPVRLEFYTEEELLDIVRRGARVLQVAMAEEGAREIARR